MDKRSRSHTVCYWI